MITRSARVFLLFTVGVLAFVQVSCRPHSGSSKRKSPRLMSITIAPAGDAVPKGRTRQFTATGKYSRGPQKDITAEVTWSSTGGGSLAAASTPTDGSGLAQVTFTVSTTAGTSHVVTATDDDELTGDSDPVMVIAAAPVQYLVSVEDTSPAAGATIAVTATSPALLGPSVAVTDSTGQYRIEDLRPGVYTVTFTLPGFSTLKREGIELTAGFTATINAELPVGSLEETITVSGESPLVDVRNVTQHNVITRDLIEDLPTGKTLQNLAVLIPGVYIATAVTGTGSVGQDVGGAVGERNVRIVVRGSYEHDSRVPFDVPPGVVGVARALACEGIRALCDEVMVLLGEVATVEQADIVLHEFAPRLIGVDLFRVGVHPLEDLVHLLGRHLLAELRVQRVESIQQRLDFGNALFDVAEHCLRRIETRLLRQEPDGDTVGGKRLADELLVFARHDLQERALPGPVEAEHADLGAGQKREPDVLEDDRVGRMNLPEPFHRVDVLHRGLVGPRNSEYINWRSG